jgi:two-component system sensor histidine kinase/response regulator
MEPERPDLPLILVADDDLNNLKVILSYVRSAEAQYRVINANNGRNAYQLALTARPDIILLDWEMPEMSGIEVVQALKKHEETADIPVIIYTGIMLAGDHLKIALEQGAVDFLRKPADRVELLSRLQAALRLSRSFKKIKEQNFLLQKQNEQIQRQNESLTELNNIKDRLFSIISHDLRSPLNDFHSLFELLQYEALTLEQLREEIPTLTHGLKSLQTLLDNLLYWSLSQMQGLALYPQPIALHDAVEQLRAFFAYQLETKGVEFENTVPSDLYVHADGNILALLLRNLIGNALKFTEAGGRIRLAAQPVPPALVDVTVADTGAGMTAAQVAKLFGGNLNQTVEGTRSERGTGLADPLPRLRRAQRRRAARRFGPRAGYRRNVLAPQGPESGTAIGPLMARIETP